MAILTQDPNTPLIYRGWYGSCPETGTETCSAFPLVTGTGASAAHVHTIFQMIIVTSSNSQGSLAYDGAVTTPFLIGMMPVKKLECGKAYDIIVKPGNGSIDVPEFNFSNMGTTDVYRLTDACTIVVSPTPTQTKPSVSLTPTPTRSILPTPTPTSGLTMCGGQLRSDGSGTAAYPHQRTVNVGPLQGSLFVNFGMATLPRRYIIRYNGAIKIDTGFRGSSAYAYTGISRAQFTAMMFNKVDPVTLNIYPFAHSSNSADGYPMVQSGASFGDFFSKNATNPLMGVEIYAPMPGTEWTVTTDCSYLA